MFVGAVTVVVVLSAAAQAFPANVRRAKRRNRRSTAGVVTRDIGHPWTRGSNRTGPGSPYICGPTAADFGKRPTYSTDAATVNTKAGFQKGLTRLTCGKRLVTAARKSGLDTESPVVMRKKYLLGTIHFQTASSPKTGSVSGVPKSHSRGLPNLELIENQGREFSSTYVVIGECSEAATRRPPSSACRPRKATSKVALCRPWCSSLSVSNAPKRYRR